MQQLSRKKSPIMMRNYGRIIQDMISYACVLQDAEQREALVQYVAQCMRQKNTVWNKDQDPGLNRISEDIERLSGGRLHYITQQAVPQQELEEQASVQQSRTKKKKK